MRSFDELVSEADAADVSGWGFAWLDGRATEQRPPWGFGRLLAERFRHTDRALDLDTGGGELIASIPQLPRDLTVTESWAPNAQRARESLATRGVRVVETDQGDPLPFDDQSFDLVTARHPVAPQWSEISRVLRPGGRYFAQHVGPASAFELIEHFLGQLPDHRTRRDPARETAAAIDAGLEIEDLRIARCRMEFFDVGAVVWILRKCVWWVPDFTPDRYRHALHELDDRMRSGQPFVAHSTRHLIDARRP